MAATILDFPDNRPLDSLTGPDDAEIWALEDDFDLDDDDEWWPDDDGDDWFDEDEYDWEDDEDS